MEKYSSPEFDKILEIEANQKCFDCDKPNPLWCSVNNAVLLCPVCARAHQKFDKTVSYIKSLEADLWKSSEVTLLKLGGNEAFAHFLTSYGIPRNSQSCIYKYYTKAAEFYRRMLYCKVTMGNPDKLIKPGLKDGIEVIDKDNYDLATGAKTIEQIQREREMRFKQAQEQTNINNVPYVNINSNNVEEMEDDSLQAQWGSFVGAVGNVFNSMGDAISKTAREYEVPEKIRNTGEYIRKKKDDISNSSGFQGFVNFVSEGVNSIFNKAEGILDEAKKTNNEFQNGDPKENYQKSRQLWGLKRNDNNMNYNNVGNNINNNLNSNISSQDINKVMQENVYNPMEYGNDNINNQAEIINDNNINNDDNINNDNNDGTNQIIMNNFPPINNDKK